jgi:MFS family permease
MTNPWAALAVLFTTRVAMAFQYQLVAALGPLFMQRHDVALADLGLLFALYLSPGVLFALPGGGIAQRLGDRRVVTLGLVMMALGGLMMWQGQTWSLQIAGRLLSGIGGVLLTVLMSKMVTDWFARGRLATAMGIFVNSWPAGIALALLTLPLIAETGGLSRALAVSFGFVVFGLALFALLYRDPPQGATGGKTVSGRWPRGAELAGIVTAGSIWGLYNAALAMVFAFGALILAERGANLTEASATVSLVLWLATLSIPAGGLLGDRIGRPDRVLTVGCIGFAACFAWALAAPGVTVFIAMGLICGLPAGPIMALPARTLPPETRALGMGLFFTLYYLWMSLIPYMAGVLADFSGRTASAFGLGIGLLCATLALLGLFRGLERSALPAGGATL